MPKYNFILNIDDNVMANTVCRILVEMNDLASDFESFTNPIEALEYLQRLSDSGKSFPELIFLDINMPEMNGWEFLEQYKSLPFSSRQTCKVFMVSSSIEKKDQDRAVTHNILAGFVEKPLTLEIFEEI